MTDRSWFLLVVSLGFFLTSPTAGHAQVSGGPAGWPPACPPSSPNPAPAGYHYEPGSCTPTPNDPCWQPELRSSGAIEKINLTVGKAGGAPSRITSVKEPSSIDLTTLASVGVRFPSGAIVCHETLALENGSSARGVVSFVDPGEYAPMQVQWISDRDIAAALARVDRLATAKNLYVKPDLLTPSIQECVGGQFARGVGEQFPGQLWAACVDQLNRAGE
jgi:hypothetical protein